MEITTVQNFSFQTANSSLTYQKVGALWEGEVSLLPDQSRKAFVGKALAQGSFVQARIEVQTLDPEDDEAEDHPGRPHRITEADDTHPRYRYTPLTSSIRLRLVNRSFTNL